MKFPVVLVELFLGSTVKRLYIIRVELLFIYLRVYIMLIGAFSQAKLIELLIIAYIVEVSLMPSRTTVYSMSSGAVAIFCEAYS